MNDTLSVLIPGEPVPQGSQRPFVTKAGRAGSRTSNADRLAPYRADIIEHVQRAMARQGWQPAARRAFQVNVMFVLRRPKSHYGTGRNAEQLKASAPRWPIRTPDVDKLLRAVNDSLTYAGVWHDDSNLVNASAQKVYGDVPSTALTVQAL